MKQDTGSVGEGRNAFSRLALARLSLAADLASWIGGAVSTLLIVVVLAITAINVVARYVFSRSIEGADEATGFLVVAIVMFGAAEAYRKGDHIRIDILADHVGLRGRWWLEALSHAGTLVFVLILMVTAWHTVQFSRAFDAYSSGYLEMPLWIPQASLVVGGFLLGLVAAVRLVGHLASRSR